MRRIAAILALSALAACDAAGGPTNDGPLALGIVSGQDQVATAGAEKLGQPVVGKLVRTPSGGITFRLVTPAYAQGTVVSGSPVPGAVVCAVSVTEGGMVPFTPCTNTGEDGTATFFFSPGTKAGEAKSEIRGQVEGQPMVFDTARAVIEPGPYVGGYRDISPMYSDSIVVLPDTLIRDQYKNPIPYRVESADTLIRAIGGEIGTEAARTLVWHWHPSKTRDEDAHFFATLADGTKVKVYYTSGGAINEWSYDLR